MMDELKTGGRGQSIWIRPERSARGPVPEHSRAEIASAGVALADASGLGAVTMRSAAAAIGTAPASLYRYIATRDELVELMADQVYGEYAYHARSTGSAVTDLLGLAHQGRAIYHRHPWLLDVPATGNLPGPNAVAFIEHALAALAGTDLAGPGRLETIGLFSGVVRLFAQTEISQRRAGQDTARWQASLAGYLVQITAAGQYPHLADALADAPAGSDPARPEPLFAPAGSDPARPEPVFEPARSDPARPEPLFERAMTRILTGLLPPARRPQASP